MGESSGPSGKDGVGRFEIAENTFLNHHGGV